ncbi:DUF397 domain-containing protein [Actinoallomurus purpureus]|nr:DUF397 domain-containing protein [Actinoallomurus purpureus]MCO6011056.1 DUF397 domain-containing protein [Actinoallomurus purpureus]
MNASDLLAIQWRKSTASTHEGGDCVEVADFSLAIVARDTTSPDDA